MDFVEVQLEVAGRLYKLKAPHHQQQDLLDAALLLNEKIAEVKAKSRQVTAEQAAVLAGLNLSCDLLTEREMLAQDREEIRQRLLQLQQQVEASLQT